MLRTTNASNKKNGAMGPATVTLERMRVTVMELSSWIKEDGLGAQPPSFYIKLVSFTEDVK